MILLGFCLTVSANFYLGRLAEFDVLCSVSWVCEDIGVVFLHTAGRSLSYTDVDCHDRCRRGTSNCKHPDCCIPMLANPEGMG